MADFLTRLAERTLGLIPVAQPAIAPIFAPGPPMAGTATETEILDTPGELQEVPVPKHVPMLQGNREVDTVMFSPPTQETRRIAPMAQPQLLPSRTDQSTRSWQSSQLPLSAVASGQTSSSVHPLEAREHHHLEPGAREQIVVELPPAASVMEKGITTNTASEGYDRSILSELQEYADAPLSSQELATSKSDELTSSLKESSKGSHKSTALSSSADITRHIDKIPLLAQHAERDSFLSTENVLPRPVILARNLDQANGKVQVGALPLSGEPELSLYATIPPAPEQSRSGNPALPPNKDSHSSPALEQDKTPARFFEDVPDTCDLPANAGHTTEPLLKRDHVVIHRQQMAPTGHIAGEYTKKESTELIDLTSHQERSVEQTSLSSTERASIMSRQEQAAFPGALPVDTEGRHVVTSIHLPITSEKAVQAAARTALVESKAGIPPYTGLQTKREAANTPTFDDAEHLKESSVEPAIAAPGIPWQQQKNVEGKFNAPLQVPSIAPVVILRQTLAEQQLLVPGTQRGQNSAHRQLTNSNTPHERRPDIAGNLALRSLFLEQDERASAQQRTSSLTAGETSPVPVIRVTIGRIDVRAVTQPATSTRQKPGIPGPALSLDDYLKQRKGGER